MRTSLTETKRIELYLENDLKGGELLLFEARMLVTPALKDKVRWQSLTHELARQYGREILKKEISLIDHTLFHDHKHSGFRAIIYSIFKK